MQSQLLRVWKLELTTLHRLIGPKFHMATQFGGEVWDMC